MLTYVFVSFRTNILTRYFNKDIKITLPDKKKLTDIKWFAVYDITRQVKCILLGFLSKKVLINNYLVILNCNNIIFFYYD